MQPLPFTLRQLQVFENLCVTLSFRECAENLGISQASVSSQIALLEDQLGCLLFTRARGKRPSLTPRGLAFRADLQKFNAAGIQLASHRSNITRGSGKRTFSILIGASLLENFIKPQLGQFLASHPNIELGFEGSAPASSLEPASLVKGCDFAMMHNRADLPVPVPWRTLALVKSGIYGSRDLVRDLPLPLSEGQVSRLPFILPQAGSVQEERILAGLAAVGIVPQNVVGHTEYFDVSAAMVERGIGVACLAESVISPSHRKQMVQLYPLANWKLCLFNKHPDADEVATAVQRFLISAVVENADYPAIEKYV